MAGSKSRIQELLPVALSAPNVMHAVDVTCRLHGKDQRLSVGINDCILTEDLSTNK
jgi:hypothetical protein